MSKKIHTKFQNYWTNYQYLLADMSINELDHYVVAKT